MTRVAVLGISTEQPCGVRDHAARLAQALAGEGVQCTTHWLAREQRALGPARAELRAWTRRLEAELAASRPDVVLLHYSVFPYSYRGLPVFAHGVLEAAGADRRPVVSMLHEFVYPWGRSGLRGALWAVTQRAALVEVARASTRLVVTADFRADWLRSKRWLPRREVSVAPVFSNLPAPSAGPTAEGRGPAIGLFGFAAEGAPAPLVLDALRLLRARGVRANLQLLGAPGRDSRAGAAWSAAAEQRGLADAVSFSGMLEAQELSDRLASCEVLLFADAPGPTPRKTTLAASLASGAPVVALDGPRTWPALAQAEAALLVAPQAGALAEALQRLLGDGRARAELGERGKAFAERQMSVAQSARVLAAALRAAAEPS